MNVRATSDTAALVQTADGSLAQAIPASEFAAIFFVYLLPEMRKRYPADPDQFHDERVRFCESRELAKELADEIPIPSNISLDHATIHPQMRLLGLQMHFEHGKYCALIRQRVAEEHGVELPEDWHPVPDPAEAAELAAAAAEPPPVYTSETAVDLCSMGNTVAERAELAAQQLDPVHQQAAQRKQRCAQLQRQREVAECKAHAELQAIGVQPEQAIAAAISHVKRRHLRACRLPPELFAPLSKCSGEIHSPIEHPIGMVKRDVVVDVLEDLCSDALLEADTYRRFIEASVAKWDQRIVDSPLDNWSTRSVDKQLCILKILAAPRGHRFQVEHTFYNGHAAAGDLRTVHWVVGTAGAYIKDSKWL